MSRKAAEPAPEAVLDNRELRAMRDHTANMERALNAQISMLEFAQRKLEGELADDLSGSNPVLHRDVVSKLAVLTKAITESSRAYVQYSKAAKSLSAAMSPDERYQAMKRYIEHQLTGAQLRDLKRWLATMDTPRGGSRSAKELAARPRTALDAMTEALEGADE